MLLAYVAVKLPAPLRMICVFLQVSKVKWDTSVIGRASEILLKVTEKAAFV